jgi:hypothetical protein
MTAPSQTSETIERELAALGEAPASAEELAMLREPGELDSLHPVASVARLAEVAEPIEINDLSELELHRGWRNVELRLARSSEARQSTPSDRSAPAPAPSGGGPRRWLFAAIGVAAAAAILVIVLRPADAPTVAKTKIDAESVSELGDQARASLKVLDDGITDTQRAEQLAAEYQARLEEQGG